jgi:hypothetical protein
MNESIEGESIGGVFSDDEENKILNFTIKYDLPRLREEKQDLSWAWRRLANDLPGRTTKVVSQKVLRYLDYAEKRTQSWSEGEVAILKNITPANGDINWGGLRKQFAHKSLDEGLRSPFVNRQVLISGDNSNSFISSGEAGPFAAVEAGNSFSLILTQEGILHTWGENCYHQCGHFNTDHDILNPCPLSLKAIISVAAGSTHCLALSRNGTVFSFGSYHHHNDNPGFHFYDFVKDGDSSPPNAPTIVNTPETFVSIFAGMNFNAGLTRSAKCFTWGIGSEGQLGREICGVFDPHPTVVSWFDQSEFIEKKIVRKVLGVSLGSNNMLIIAQDVVNCVPSQVSVYSAGYNGSGKLGHEIEEKSCIKTLKKVGHIVFQINVSIKAQMLTCFSIYYS